MSVFNTSVIRQEHKMSVFIQAVPFHLFKKFPDLDIRFFNRLDIFRRHPFMFMPGMIGMHGIKKYQSGITFISLQKRKCLFIIRDISILFQIADFIQILLVIRIEQIYPVIIKSRLHLRNCILKDFKYRWIITITVRMDGRQLEFGYFPTVVNNSMLFRTTSRQMACPIGQSHRRHNHPRIKRKGTISQQGIQIRSSCFQKSFHTNTIERYQDHTLGFRFANPIRHSSSRNGKRGRT